MPPNDVTIHLQRQKPSLHCDLKSSGYIDEKFCKSPQRLSRSFVVDGEQDALYQVRILVRGVMELCAYEGGDHNAEYWQIGGVPHYENRDSNQYRLEISSPPQVYYLNRSEDPSKVMGVRGIRYEAVIYAETGAVITLNADPGQYGYQFNNNLNIRLIDTDLEHPIKVTQPFEGQWVQIDAIDAVRIDNKVDRDPYFYDVSLLIHGYGNNKDRTFKDHSRFCHAIKVIGDPYIETNNGPFYDKKGYIRLNSKEGLILESAPHLELYESDQWTIELLVYLRQIGDFQTLVAKKDVRVLNIDEKNSYSLSINRDDSRLVVQGDLIKRISNDFTIPHQWCHLSATFNHGKLIQHVDWKVSSVLHNFKLGKDKEYDLMIGILSDMKQSLDASIAEIRINKDVARYSDEDIVPFRNRFPDC